MRETDDIERLFQESFEGFEVTPPASVKTAIDKGTKSTKRFVWWLSALFIMLATIASSLIYFNANKSAQKQNNVFAKNNITFHQKTNQTSISDESTIAPYKKKTSENQKPNSISGTKDSKTKQNSASAKSTKSSTDGKVNRSKTSGSQKNVSLGKSDKKTKKKIIKNKVKGNSGSTGSKTNETKIAEENDTALNNSIKTSDISSALNNSPVDSSTVSKTDSVQVADSTSTAVNTVNDSAKDNNKDKSKSSDEKWLASYYFGPQYDLWNNTSKDFELKTKPSIRTSVEISRQLKYGISVSSGLGYNKLNETTNANHFTIDSTYLGTDTIPVYWDSLQNPDSIVGYNYVQHYNVDTSKSTITNKYTTTAFYIPLYVNKTFELSDKWVVMTSLGANFNFYKTKTQGDSDPNSPVKGYNSFGINAALRLYGGYKFNNWMITAGFTYSLYLKTPVVYNGITSQRMFVSPQLGIHYTF